MKKIFVSGWDTEDEARDEQDAQARALVALRKTDRHGVMVEQNPRTGQWNVYLIDRGGE